MLFLQVDGDDSRPPPEPAVPEASGAESLPAAAALFSPPLYLQRYEAALSVLRRRPWRRHMAKVVDLGCAECKLLRRLGPALPALREAVGVDVDRGLLEDAARWTEPVVYNHLVPRQKTRLDMHLMAGSAAEYDARLAGADAVTAIEL